MHPEEAERLSLATWIVVIRGEGTIEIIACGIQVSENGDLMFFDDRDQYIRSLASGIWTDCHIKNG